jgi:hypothetical protein
LAFEPNHFTFPTGKIDEERRHTGEQIAPDALGEIHDSLTPFYKLFPRYIRPLKGDATTAASSAARRDREKPDYRSPALEEYLAGGGPLTTVREARD